jgi:hypothetical protein
VASRRGYLTREVLAVFKKALESREWPAKDVANAVWPTVTK